MKTQRTATTSFQPNNTIRWQEITNKALAGNISYGSTMQNTDQDQNLHVWKATGTTPGTANVEFAIHYQLDHLPLTIVGYDLDRAGNLYRGSTPWTFNAQKQSGIVYLKCSVASAKYNVILG